MNVKMKRLGTSEKEIEKLRSLGFKYDKRTVRQMIAANNKTTGASLDSIKKLEFDIGSSLPDDYKDFLISYDGGLPEPAAFDIPRENNSSIVKEFFGLDTPLLTASIEYNRRMYENRIPKKFLVIGCDVFGNRIILGIKNDNYGEIFFWDHENEADEDNVEEYYENIYLISKNFSDFLNSLRNPEK